jgi:hypothetical protein
VKLLNPAMYSFSVRQSRHTQETQILVCEGNRLRTVVKGAGEWNAETADSYSFSQDHLTQIAPSNLGRLSRTRAPRCPLWVMSRHNGPVRVMSVLPPIAGHSSVQVECPKSAISRRRSLATLSVAIVQREAWPSACGPGCATAHGEATEVKLGGVSAPTQDVSGAAAKWARFVASE